ncbi:unnamed protein product [Cochlearia groenlandica]
MSLNCLACHNLQRSDSDRDIRRSLNKDPNFTEKLATSRYDKMLRNKSSLPIVRKIKTGHHHHRRLYSAETVMVYEDLEEEPKLIRSSGIRRDWSFENLQKQREGRKIDKFQEIIE